MHKRNKITIVIEDVDPEAGTIKMSSSFDTMPDIELGPQTPAEIVAAKAMDYLQRYAIHASPTPSIILPEDYIDSDVNRNQFIDEIVRAENNKKH